MTGSQARCGGTAGTHKSARPARPQLPHLGRLRTRKPTARTKRFPPLPLFKAWPLPTSTRFGQPAEGSTRHHKEISVAIRANRTSMNVPIRKPWTQEQFFSWAEAQDIRYEFDGSQPVAMTGGNAGHSLITRTLHRALDARLRRGPCLPLGPDAGVETVNSAVRYPDALVTCSKFALTDKIIPGVVVVFEVLSPTSGRVDRIVKVREYAAVPSIRRYVILESTGPGLTVMERAGPDEVWRTTVLTNDDILRVPEIGIEIPVAEFYEDVTFPDEGEASD